MNPCLALNTDTRNESYLMLTMMIHIVFNVFELDKLPLAVAMCAGQAWKKSKAESLLVLY